jgi:hypothetical protein
MPDDQEFDQLLEASFAELQMKTAAHQAGWGFGKFDRWNMDMDRGDLIFSNRDGTTATCPAQVIGSHDSVDGTWMWAWANASIPESLRIDAQKVKEYGESHEIERLITPEFAADEMVAWTMTALAAKLCESQGAYRGPAGRNAVFMTFREVKLSKTEVPARKWRWPWSR